MRKLIALFFVASVFTFASCDQQAGEGTQGGDTTQVAPTEPAPAEDAEVQPIESNEVDTTAQGGEAQPDTATAQ